MTVATKHSPDSSIAVFLSRNSALPPNVEIELDDIRSGLLGYGFRVIEIAPAEYLYPPWRQLRSRIAECDGLLAFATVAAVPADSKHDETWLQIEGAMALALGIPVLVIAKGDGGPSDGIFDRLGEGEGLHFLAGTAPYSIAEASDWVAEVQARATTRSGR